MMIFAEGQPNPICIDASPSFWLFIYLFISRLTNWKIKLNFCSRGQTIPEGLMGPEKELSAKSLSTLD